MWPNPAKAVLNIELPINDKAVQVQIFDVSRKTVLTAMGRAFDILEVNIIDLKPGIYLFKVIMPTHGVAAGKFIVE